jgi:hypothetical protein
MRLTLMKTLRQTAAKTHRSHPRMNDLSIIEGEYTVLPAVADATSLACVNAPGDHEKEPKLITTMPGLSALLAVCLEPPPSPVSGHLTVRS